MYIDCILSPKNKEQASKDEIEDFFEELFDYKDNIIRIDSRNLKCKFRIPQNEKYCAVLIELKGDSKEEADILSECKKRLRHNKLKNIYMLTFGMDESSLYYSIKSYKLLSKYERNLRYLTYLTMIHANGKDWADLSANESKHFNSEYKSKDSFKEKALEEFSLNKIGLYLFEKNPEINSDNFFKLFDKYSKNTKINDDQKLDEIIELIKKYRGKSIWETYFNYENLDFVEKTFNKIRYYRNDVMHHHNINKEEFDNKKKMILKSNKLIEKAIKDVEEDYIEINLIDVNISMEKITQAIQKALHYDDTDYMDYSINNVIDYLNNTQHTRGSNNYKKVILSNPLHKLNLDLITDDLEKMNIIDKYNLYDLEDCNSIL